MAVHLQKSCKLASRDSTAWCIFSLYYHQHQHHHSHLFLQLLSPFPPHQSWRILALVLFNKALMSAWCASCIIYFFIVSVVAWNLWIHYTPSYIANVGSNMNANVEWRDQAPFTLEPSLCMNPVGLIFFYLTCAWKGAFGAPWNASHASQMGGRGTLCRAGSRGMGGCMCHPWQWCLSPWCQVHHQILATRSTGEFLFFAFIDKEIAIL